MQEKTGYSIKDVVTMGPLGTSSVYAAINDGRLRAKKFGKKTFITRKDWEAFIDGSPDYQPRKSAHVA